MKYIMHFAAIGEATTGLALLIAPSLVGLLLLGSELGGIGELVVRVAGIALLGLGIACWPGCSRAGMLVYSTGVALVLGYAGLSGMAGVLLWPAVILHLLISVALAIKPRFS